MLPNRRRKGLCVYYNRDSAMAELHYWKIEKRVYSGHSFTVMGLSFLALSEPLAF